MTNRSGRTIQRTNNDLGMNDVKWQQVGVLLRQYNDIAFIDIFNKKKEGVAIIDVLILFVLIRYFNMFKCHWNTVLS